MREKGSKSGEYPLAPGRSLERAGPVAERPEHQRVKGQPGVVLGLNLRVGIGRGQGRGGAGDMASV